MDKSGLVVLVRLARLADSYAVLYAVQCLGGLDGEFIEYLEGDCFGLGFDDVE